MIQFYAYLWFRSDGSPYYVGKGHGDRAFCRGCPKDKSRIQILECRSEEEAFEEEKLLISCYGRKDIGTGILRNRTNGGEGFCGSILPPWTEEMRAKVSAAAKLQWAKHRNKMKASMQGIPKSLEHRLKISKTIKKMADKSNLSRIGKLGAQKRWHKENGSKPQQNA